MPKNIAQIINNIEYGNGNTTSLYGLAYLLLLQKDTFLHLNEFIVDLILDSVQELQYSIGKYYFISDTKIQNDYHISHYYNFSLNLLSYVGLNNFQIISSYRRKEITQIVSYIKEFLSYEVKFLNNYEKKTIAFELVVGKYISRLENFTDNKFVKSIKDKRGKRLSKKSNLLAFSPEGLDTPEQNKQLILIFKQLASLDDRNFLLNSPEASITFDKLLEELYPNSIEKLIIYIKENKGLPPKFNAEYFDFFWIIDILYSGTNLNEYKNILLSKVDDLNLFNGKLGALTPEKGFSIAREFPLYDLDTTAMAIKGFKILGIDNNEINNYDYSYYQNKDNQLYSTYKNDNRVSITTLCHTLDSQLSLGITPNQKVLEHLVKSIFNHNYTDKWHASDLYSLYVITVFFVNLYKKEPKNLYEDILELLIKDLLKYRKSNGLFTSINYLEGTQEETSWAILALNYINNNYKYLQNNLSKLLNISVQSLRQEMEKEQDYERLWLVKQTYSPFKIIDSLINTAAKIND